MVAIKDMEMPKQCASCFARAMVDGEISTYEICTLTESVLSTEDLCDRRNPNCPLVEIEERKQSEWYLRGGKFTCKNCEERALLKLTDATGGCREYSYYTSKFCPNCGAEMRGSEND